MSSINLGSSVNHQDDQQLIDRIQADEQGALHSLIRRWETNVLNLAFRIMGDRETALDIRQKTFLRVCHAIPDFDHRSNFSTWIYRIVINICRDEICSRQSRNKMMENYQKNIATDSSAIDADEQDHERTQTIIDAVMSLPFNVREAVILRHYHGLTLSQMSEILEVPATTLSYRTLQGLKKLRTKLKIECE